MVHFIVLIQQRILYYLYRNINYNCVFPGTASAFTFLEYDTGFKIIVGTIFGDIFDCEINYETVLKYII